LPLQVGHLPLIRLAACSICGRTASGISGAIAKTATAPIERVKLIIQTQDSNPLIRSGQVKRYTGIADCFSRVASEQGIKAFWRGNFVNVLRYFPTQAFNFAFKDTIKAMLPKVDKKNVMASLGVNFWLALSAMKSTRAVIRPYVPWKVAATTPMIMSQPQCFQGISRFYRPK
jgi:hypothetical protein